MAYYFRHNTPGPWTTGINDLTSEDVTIWGKNEWGKDFIIATVRPGVPGPEKIENAKLIAAAPELADCCQLLLSLLTSNHILFFEACGASHERAVRDTHDLPGIKKANELLKRISSHQERDGLPI